MMQEDEEETIRDEPPHDGRAPVRRTRRNSGLLLILALVALPAIIGYPVMHYIGKLQSREGCAAGLKSIGQALYLYAHTNGGAFPDSYATLAKNDPDLFVALFICPWTPEYKTFSRQTPLIDVLESGTPRISYIYAAAGLTTASPAAAVLAYEPLSNHGAGSNVMFADGHIEFLEKSKAQALIAELQAGHNPPRPETLK